MDIGGNIDLIIGGIVSAIMIPIAMAVITATVTTDWDASLVTIYTVLFPLFLILSPILGVFIKRNS
jgi:MFS family permease